MPRINREVYFMKIASLVAERATCLRARVGAVIVKNNRIIATGYNGSPKGQPHCLDAGCEMIDGHCVRTTHAEQNAIIECARHGVSTDGSVIYVTSSPCYACAKMIINAGIVKVIYLKKYSGSVIDYLEKAGIEVERGRV